MVKTLRFQCRGHGFNPWLEELRSCMSSGAVIKQKIDKYILKISTLFFFFFTSLKIKGYWNILDYMCGLHSVSMGWFWYRLCCRKSRGNKFQLDSIDH